MGTFTDTSALLTGSICIGILTVIASCLVTSPAAAKSELWSEAGVRYKLNKKWRFGFDQHLRLDLSPFQASAILPEVHASWSFTKRFRLSAAYRFVHSRNGKGRFYEGHRFHMDLRYSNKWKKIRIEDRVRLQAFVTDDFNRDNSQTLRNKLQIGYDTDARIEPFVASEIHYRLGGNRGAGLHKIWFDAGATADFGGHDLTLSYRLEQPIADDNDPVSHIFGLAYHYSL